MANTSGTPVGRCPKCKFVITDDYSKTSCLKCREPLPPEIVRQLPLVVGDAEFDDPSQGTPGTQYRGREEMPVVITDINMRFSSMIVFMVKWAFAAIPAIIIIYLIIMIAIGIGIGAFSHK